MLVVEFFDNAGGIARSLCRIDQSFVPLQQIANAVEQFGKRKGLGDILIRPAIEGVHLVLTQSSRTENEDRNQSIDEAYRLANLVTAHPR